MPYTALRWLPASLAMAAGTTELHDMDRLLGLLEAAAPPAQRRGPGGERRGDAVDPGADADARRSIVRASDRRGRGTWYRDGMEGVRIETGLPAALAAQAHAFVAEGGGSDLDERSAEALRRFLESHTFELTESFMKEDVQWGLHGDD